MWRGTFIKTVLAALLLAGQVVAAPVFAQEIPFKVGVTPGPHAQIMEVVRQVAAKEGLNVQIIEFSNFVLPNEALANGELNANSMQHKPYLDNQIRARGFKLSVVGNSVLLPMAIYSKKVTSIADIKPGSRVGIPNDPTNGGRALLLLQQEGLIKLAPNAGLTATPLDIKENRLGLKIVELDAAQMPRSLEDLDVGVVNTNYAIAAGLDPKKEALAIESVNSPYVNVIVVREADKNSEAVAKFLRAYHSPEVKRFIEETFKGAVLPGW